MKMSFILETCQLKTFLLSLMAEDFLFFPSVYIFYAALYFRDFECIFDLSSPLAASLILLLAILQEPLTDT